MVLFYDRKYSFCAFCYLWVLSCLNLQTQVVDCGKTDRKSRHHSCYRDASESYAEREKPAKTPFDVFAICIIDWMQRWILPHFTLLFILVINEFTCISDNHIFVVCPYCGLQLQMRRNYEFVAKDLRNRLLAKQKQK